MADRKSILDDAAFDKIGSRGAAKAARGGGKSAKLVVAIALFLVAGGLIAWQAGLFDSFAKAKGGTQLTPEEIKAKSDQEHTREIDSNDKGKTTGQS